jgi:hypothetical protein
MGNLRPDTARNLGCYLPKLRALRGEILGFVWLTKVEPLWMVYVIVRDNATSVREMLLKIGRFR